MPVARRIRSLFFIFLFFFLGCVAHRTIRYIRSSFFPLSPLARRNSDPASLVGRLFSPLPTAVRAFSVYRDKA